MARRSIPGVVDLRYNLLRAQGKSPLNWLTRETFYNAPICSTQHQQAGDVKKVRNLKAEIYSFPSLSMRLNDGLMKLK
ncbi:MAG: hypothetical protein KIH08_04545 [Candidatus Freyarchaeota archaeon]|nr:hypothetical protein [Candidatus Jordarchaeia archaeon]MBS7268170.1 hypothetical protein [Candidatus Jordarchaeia archaeon]MBS7279924.1 hypothetical protein [Candidatus Jordarchaeia archaeon]